MSNDLDAGYDGYEELESQRPRPTKTFWVTREGDSIAVVDMEDGHLVNTIRMIRRRALRVKSINEAVLLRGHDSLNGEMAHDALDEEIEASRETSADEWATEHVPCYALMLRETVRRNLTVPPITETEQAAAMHEGLRILMNGRGE